MSVHTENGLLSAELFSSPVRASMQSFAVNGMTGMCESWYEMCSAATSTMPEMGFVTA